MRRCEQGRDLGCSLLRVATPATGFTDIDKAHGLGSDPVGLPRNLREQALLLRAGNKDRLFSLHRALKRRDLSSTKRGMKGQRLIQASAKGWRVQRHRPVAIADQRRHGLQLRPQAAPR